MEDRYGETHYGVFHVLLPEVVFSDILEGFMLAVRGGVAEEMLALIWKKAACRVLGLPPMSAVPPDLDVDAASFEVRLTELSVGTTLVLITAPPVSGPLQAGFAAITLDAAQPGVPPRYFTFEAPAMEFFPWMVGEWLAPGHRANLGMVTDPTIAGLYDFVRDQLGCGAAPPRPASADVRVMDDRDGHDGRGPVGRRASWPARMTARALRALARGQENAGGGRLPLRRTPRRGPSSRAR